MPQELLLKRAFFQVSIACFWRLGWYFLTGIITLFSSVVGGGVALLYATRGLRNLKASNEDQRRGIQIIENALKVPLYEHINFS